MPAARRATTSPDPPVSTGGDPDGLEPLPRPTLRLPGGDSGFPSPFAYRRGGGYIQMTLIITAPPGSATDALYWNLATGGALADPQFRHACARAINREDFIQRLYGGNATVGKPGYMPPENPVYVEDVEQYPFDLEAANELLDAAGYQRGPEGLRQGPDGQPLRFTLLVTNPFPRVTELAVAALAEVGVEVVAEALDTPTFNERVIAGETDHIFNKDVFDHWYFTTGGVGVRVPAVLNRHVFVTGLRSGLGVRPTR